MDLIGPLRPPCTLCSVGPRTANNQFVIPEKPHISASEFIIHHGCNLLASNQKTHHSRSCFNNCLARTIKQTGRRCIQNQCKFQLASRELLRQERRIVMKLPYQTPEILLRFVVFKARVCVRSVGRSLKDLRAAGGPLNQPKQAQKYDFSSHSYSRQTVKDVLL